MKRAIALPIPFNELPPEARMVFFLIASSALFRYDSPRTDQTKMTDLLEATWKANQFVVQDLSDPFRMTDRLKSYFASLARSISSDGTR